MNVVITMANGDSFRYDGVDLNFIKSVQDNFLYQRPLFMQKDGVERIFNTNHISTITFIEVEE